MDAGGDPVWKDSELGKSWTTVTIEQIAAWNPDVIFVVSYKSPVNDVVASLKTDPPVVGIKSRQRQQAIWFCHRCLQLGSG